MEKDKFAETDHGMEIIDDRQIVDGRPQPEKSSVQAYSELKSRLLTVWLRTKHGSRTETVEHLGEDYIYTHHKCSNCRRTISLDTRFGLQPSIGFDKCRR
jgi:hypothetical protein